MVKLAVLFTAGLASLTALVTADSFRKDINYCGSGLLNKGNYYNEIVAELEKNRQGVDPQHVSQSLFNCLADGWITFNSYCSMGCHDGGKSRSDSCN